MPDELTAEAKKEIADAIQIVREDRMDKLIRTRLASGNPPVPDPTNTPPNPNPVPPTNNPNNPPHPPPPNPSTDPNNPPVPPTPRKKGIWWGDAVDE